MRVLLDTNILLRSVQPGHPDHPLARRATGELLARGDEVYLVPQNLYELWVVVTRPVKDNGLGCLRRRPRRSWPGSANSSAC